MVLWQYLLLLKRIEEVDEVISFKMFLFLLVHVDQEVRCLIGPPECQDRSLSASFGHLASSPDIALVWHLSLVFFLLYRWQG